MAFDPPPPFYWALLGWIGLYWSLLGCIRLYWTVLGFTKTGSRTDFEASGLGKQTRLYWALLGSTRLYWALVEFTGVY